MIKKEKCTSWKVDQRNVDEISTATRTTCRPLGLSRRLQPELQTMSGRCRGGRGKLDKPLSGKSATRNALIWAEQGAEQGKRNKREPCNGLQGEGSLGSYCRREDSRRIGAAVRGPSEPDHDLEAAAHRECRWRFRHIVVPGPGRGRELSNQVKPHLLCERLTMMPGTICSCWTGGNPDWRMQPLFV